MLDEELEPQVVEDQLEVPWQYDWKRPQWNVVTTDDDDNEKKESQHPLCHSSAALSPEEAISNEDELRSLGIKDNNTGKYILNVTLMVDKNTKPSLRKRRQSQDHIQYADAMLVELI